MKAKLRRVVRSDEVCGCIRTLVEIKEPRLNQEIGGKHIVLIAGRHLPAVPDAELGAHVSPAQFLRREGLAVHEFAFGKGEGEIRKAQHVFQMAVRTV